VSDEEDLPTFEEEEEKNTRLFGQKEYTRRQKGPQEQEEERSLETDGVMNERFPKRERLRLKRDFENVFENGKVIQNDFFVLFYVENGLDHPRLGVVVKRKFGKAWARNKLKRWVREIFRKDKAKFKEGYDYVILPRKRLSESFDRMDYWLVKRLIEELLERVEA